MLFREYLSDGKDTSRLWAPAAGVVLWIALLLFAGKTGWQHVGLVALVWACLSRRTEPNRFVREWWPLILFWIGYDGLRLLEPWLLPRVEVRAPFQWEKSLFSLPSGQIAPFYFADLSARCSNLLFMRLVRTYCSFVYLTQLWAIPVITLAIWMRRAGILFRKIVWCFTALHLVTLSVYLWYPAAPPWWVYENGFIQPSLQHSFPHATAGSRTLATLFHLSANRFAAIPSLHGAYPLLLSLVLGMHGVNRKLVGLSYFYAVSMWFSTVFLNQHYVVDLLLGAVAAGMALPFARLKPTDRADSGPRP